VKQVTGFGTAIDMEKWGIDTFVFGTDTLVRRIVHARRGEAKVDSGSKTITFKTEYGEKKCSFRVQDDLLFFSDEGYQPNTMVAVYRRQPQK
jgi:hypothetical protein